MKINLLKALLVASACAVAPFALSEPVTADGPGVLQAKQARLAAQEKQKERLEEKRVDPPVAATASGATLELPMDQTDSPGATR